MGFRVGASGGGEAHWSWSLVCCCYDYYCLELVVLFLEMLLVRYGWWDCHAIVDVIDIVVLVMFLLIEIGIFD